MPQTPNVDPAIPPGPVSDDPTRSRKRVLQPNERIAEVLFGLIMVLTFTGSLSVAEADRKEVRIMLIGALGCNLAWGIIDAIFYLMGCLAERATNSAALRAVRRAKDPQKAHRVIAGSVSPALAGVLVPADLEMLRRRLLELPEPPEKSHLSPSDWRGAFGVFLLVFLSTFPVALPFIFLQNPVSAMRVSNLIAILMLFIMGTTYGRCIGRSPWLTGLAAVILGGVLVAMTMALGG